MHRKLVLMLMAGAACCLAMEASATHPHGTHLTPPACPPGCKIVEEVCYKEVCRDVCKPVPEVKKIKKWVYSCKSDPFCIPTGGPNVCGLGGKCKTGCDKCKDQGCPHCVGPYSRNLLVKREIVVDEIVTTKCVVEKVTEVVPYKVYRIVPCEAAPCVTAPVPSGTVPAPSVPHVLPKMPPATGAVPAVPSGVPAALAPLSPIGIPAGEAR